MDYGKWKYQQKKKEHKNRSHAHKSEMKGVRLRPKIDVHDLSIKVGKARQFLGEGHKVQFTMLFRGREMAHRELGYKVMEQVKADLEELSKVEASPKMMGKRMTMVLAPGRTGTKDGSDKAPAASGSVATDDSQVPSAPAATAAPAAATAPPPVSAEPPRADAPAS